MRINHYPTAAYVIVDGTIYNLNSPNHIRDYLFVKEMTLLNPFCNSHMSPLGPKSLYRYLVNLKNPPPIIFWHSNYNKKALT